MIARSTIGWQTMLADLSLILFMVTASAMADPPVKPGGAKPAPPPRPVAAPSAPVDPDRAGPLALWRPAPGGMGLGPWLAGQQIDSRQRLTITLHYPPGTQARALAEAARLMGEAGAFGAQARVVMEPGPKGAPPETTASLAYDRGDAD